jgi:hypothetical protein
MLMEVFPFSPIKMYFIYPSQGPEKDLWTTYMTASERDIHSFFWSLEEAILSTFWPSFETEAMSHYQPYI